MQTMVPLYGFGGGSGGTVATLTVTAPAGATVTVTKDGKTKTKVADSSGLAVFKGLASGEWTISITDGEQTAQKTVTITADYSTAITFFSATIHITYPKGSTCTATDGTTTLTAPDTRGTWECVVPNAGTWTIKFVDGETEFYSKDIDITENEQSVNVAPVFLYYYGNECTGITGGWDTITSNAVFKKYGTFLYAKGAKGTAVGGMKTKLKFNPSGKTIYIDCKPVKETTIGNIFIQFNLSDNAYTGSPNAQSTVNATLNQRVVTPLDTSAINSAGLIGIMTNGNDAVNVYRVWME